MSLELVLLVPVLVLLTVFVLWAGRGGRAALTADLAAEEAATAAALCCEQNEGGGPDRDVLVEEMLEARPGLEFLCVGGLRPGAPADDGGGSHEFVQEEWVEFEPASGSSSGGVGVLGVQFGCRSDGAMAPLRGLFPTVDFTGQASEVIIRRPPPPDIGFSRDSFTVVETAAALNFKVDIAAPVIQDILVVYQLDRAADPGLDYMLPAPPALPPPAPPAPPESVLLAGGTDSVDISVTLVNEDDMVYEGTERLVLRLVGLVDPSTGDPLPDSVAELDDDRVTATGVVEDDDPPPYLFLHAPSCQVDEGESVTLEVRLRDEHNTAFAPSASTVTVDVTTADVTAEAASDYTALLATSPHNPVTFNSPGTNMLVTVQILDDRAAPEGEDTETFTVRLSNENGAPLGSVREVTCEIRDDEVRVTAADVTVDEGDRLTFSLSLDRDPSADITVGYRLVDHNLASRHAERGAAPCDGDDDYLELIDSITVKYPHNHLQAVDLRPVRTCDDALVEFDETFWLEISIPTDGGEAVVEPGEGAVGTIRNDDIPTVSITADPADATGTEGQPNPLKFTVSLTVNGSQAQLSEDVSVDYTIGGSTDTAAGPRQADADYAIALDGTDLTGSALEGTLTFTAGPPAVTEHVFEARLLADHRPEGNETFVLDLDNLTDPIGAAVFEDRYSDPDTDDSHIVATIVEDSPPALSVGDFSDSEGTDQSFTVTLSHPRADETVTVDYTITGAAACPGADAGLACDPGQALADYTVLPNREPLSEAGLTGRLEFAAGPPAVTQRTVEVSLLPDLLPEDAETLRLTLSNPDLAVLTDRDPRTSGVQAYGEGTIVNQGAPPLLFVDDTEAREGERLTFTVTLCNPIAGEDVTVKYRTRAHSAAAGLDFVADSGTLTFPDAMATQQVTQGCGTGVTAKAKTLTVEVATLNDSPDESSEEVHLVLSDRTPDHIGFGKAVGVGRIINVSAATVRVSNPRADEGDPLRYVITLEDNDGNPAVITAPVTVHYSTANRGADGGAACTAGTDYIAPAAGMFTFQPAGTVRAHPVPPVVTCIDTEDEPDETVALVLALAPGTDNAGLGDTEGTGTIVDVAPDLTIDHVTAREGDPLLFQVTLRLDGRPTAAGQAVWFTASTEDGTADAGHDYTARRERLSIPVNGSSVLFEVTTLDDHMSEPPETVRAVLSDPQGAHIDGGVALGTITEACITIDGDDDPGAFTAHDTDVFEDAAWATPQVSLIGPLCENALIVVRSFDGTADGGLQAATNDYSGQLTRDEREFTLPAADTRRARFGRVGFRIAQDDRDEDDETFYMQINWSPNLPPKFQGKPPAIAEVTIIDDDPEPVLRIAEASALEGGDMTFEVSMDRVSERGVTVQYRTVPGSGTAASGVDYTPSGWTTLTFQPRSTTATFAVQTASDTAVEGSETFLVELGMPVHATIGDGTAVGTILEENLPELRIYDASVDEGATDTTMQLRVELSEAAAHTVTVDYSTVERPAGLRAAEEGADYEPVSAQPLEFQPGDTVEFARVTVKADSVPEVDETFLVELANASGAALATATAVGTINGEVTCMEVLDFHEVPRVWTIAEVAAREDSAAMTFVIELLRPACESFGIVFFTNPLFSTAEPNVDFFHMHERRSFRGMHDVLSFEVPLIDDDLDEGDETIVLQFSNPAGRPDVRVTGTIIDDDAVVVSVDDARTSEGDELSFTVRLSVPSERDVVVDYATVAGTAHPAEAGVDYTSATSQTTIPAGRLAAPVRVRTLHDALDEFDETLGLRLSDARVLWSPPQAAPFAPGGDSGVGTIVDDDAPPEARVSGASADEGGALEFVVTLSAPSGREVSIPVATLDGTARAADGDYVALATATSVVFAPGITRQTVRVQTLDDDAVESSEILWLELGPMLADNDTATIGDSLGRGVIRDTSNRQVSVSDAAVIEGGDLAFEIGFSEGPSSRDVTVRYRTRAGTATPGDDYDNQFESATRELKIVAGDTSATVLVPTEWDRLDEDNETLELVLSSPDGAEIVGGTASGVIFDDDPEPALRVSDTEATEADGASATFTLTLSEASGRDVTVDYETADDTANAGADYTAPTGRTPGTMPMTTITAGNTTATVDVALINDDVEEDVETFRLKITGAVNAQRDDSTGVATIIDDDGLPQILVDDPADVYEGDGASAAFTVRLSRADPDNPITVMYSTADGTANAGNDYTASSRTLTFTAGQSARTVTVPLVNDDISEDAETFRLVLSGPSSNAEIGDGEATVLILDDDGLPTLSVADAAAATEGATTAFTITSNREVAQDVTVAYSAVTDPTAAAEAAATVGLDYTATFGTATIAARAATATVSVPLLDDSFDENTETFWLRLASPTGATIVDGTATGTVNDDDPLPAISIADTGAQEGSTLSFEVRLDTVSGRTVTVPWATEALPAGVSAASPGADYTTASGTVTVAPGTITARIEVESLPDDIDEADERFLVQLGTPTNAALDDDTAVGAIRDDDGEPRISIADTTVDEDDGPAIFAVTLSHPSSRPVTVGYDTADGTATTHTAANPGDYAPDQVRTLTIPAAFTAGEISVFINDDTDAEGTETFTITLTNPVNAVIAEGAGTATGTILDDEGTPRLSVTDAQECEDSSSLADCAVRLCRTPRGTWTYEEYMACQQVLAAPGACQEGMCGGDGMFEFAVQLSHASTEETSVRYSTAAASAASPRDYVATTGTLTIPAGDTTASIRVALVDDGVHERQTETFRLVLDNPAGVELVTEQATGTIRDDDLPPLVSAEPFDAFSNENDGFAYHRLSLSHPSDLTGSVDYAFGFVGDRSGLPSLDDTPGTITFAPGVVEQTIDVPLFDNNVSTDTPIWVPRYANAVYRIELSDFFNLSRGFTVGSGVVWDDETAPYVESVAAQDVLEGAGSATFTITLNRFSDTAVTATYRTADGTAAAGSDYTATEATVTFPADALTADVTVPVLDDTDIEADETFTLSIINDPRNSNLTYLAHPINDGQHGIGSATVTIIDDDTDPELAVADTSANENAGTMPFRVTLSRAGASDVTVRYTTADGTAMAGSDYTAASDTLTIETGDTGATVSVPIIDDRDDTETDETFTLTLSDASGADISTTYGTATATIIEDSDLPAMTVDDAARSESLTPYRPYLDFGFSVSEPLTRTVTIDWEVVEVPSLGDEAATIGSDFLPPSAILGINRRTPTSGSLQLRRGRFGNLVSNLYFMGFEVVADTVPERDERFQLVLSNPRGVTLTRTVAWGTIENDDLPIVTVADARASESDGTVVFNLQLHAPGLDPASLAYTTVVMYSADAAASPGDDYTTASGTLDIPAGATTATISVPIIADTADEEDERFLLVLFSPENLEFRDRVAVGVITDDDDGYWIRDRSVWENAGTMDFTLQRDHTSTSPVTVNYRIRTGGSAVGGTECTDADDNYIADYVTPSGTVTMPAAATTATIDIEICDDDDAEGRENLLLELTGVTGRQTIAVGTIVDDERTDLFRINIGDSASRIEALHDTLGAQFQITADRILRGDVTVTWRTEDCLATDTLCPNPATAGTDYTADSGIVTLTSTDPSATVTVNVLNDTTDEDNEQFFVRITDVTAPAVIGSGATHADPVGIGRIIDDDGEPTLYVRDSCAVEGDLARIPVVLSHAHTSHIFGQVSVTGGTATPSDDIGGIGPLNLARRDTTDYIEIEVIQDDIPEGTETLELELNLSPRDLAGIELGDTTATLTIREDSCD